MRERGVRVRHGALCVLVLSVLVVVAGSSAQASAPTSAQASPPKCWGAASRDPQHRCFNPALSDQVDPTPFNAPLIPLGFCGGASKVGPISMCSFGVDPTTATGTVALIGDSHAGAFLPAMHYVAEANDWNGLAYIHNGCEYTDALMAVGKSYQSQCRTWAQAVTVWLGQHPQISTLVITGADQRSYVGSASAGFEKLWKSLPASIHRIFIIRDVPHELLNEADCVTSALARHKPAGTTCEQPRSKVLDPDAEATAAASSGNSRVHLIDLTPFFCSAQVCYPVVGGVLVLSDVQHMTRYFSLTMGPYVLRAINAVK